MGASNPSGLEKKVHRHPTVLEYRTTVPPYHHSKPSACSGPLRGAPRPCGAPRRRRGRRLAPGPRPAPPRPTTDRPAAPAQASLKSDGRVWAAPLPRHPPRLRPAASPRTERSAARRRRRASRAATLALALMRSAQAERSSLAQTEQRPRQRSLLRPPDARAAAAAAVAASSPSLPPSVWSGAHRPAPGAAVASRRGAVGRLERRGVPLCCAADSPSSEPARGADGAATARAVAAPPIRRARRARAAAAAAAPPSSPSFPPCVVRASACARTRSAARQRPHPYPPRTYCGRDMNAVCN